MKSAKNKGSKKIDLLPRKKFYKNMDATELGCEFASL